MARVQQLKDEQRQLLRITGRMPLASVANLASALGATEDRVRAMLGRLRSGRLGVIGHAGHDRKTPAPFLPHPPGGEPALPPPTTSTPAPGRRPAPRAWPISTRRENCWADFQERFSLDHDHPPHLEGPGDSPFTACGEAEDGGAAHGHEHPLWTATSRGVEMSPQRLAMLKPVYRLAPDESTGPPMMRRRQREKSG